MFNELMDYYTIIMDKIDNKTVFSIIAKINNVRDYNEYDLSPIKPAMLPYLMEYLDNYNLDLDPNIFRIMENFFNSDENISFCLRSLFNFCDSSECFDCEKLGKKYLYTWIKIDPKIIHKSHSKSPEMDIYSLSPEKKKYFKSGERKIVQNYSPNEFVKNDLQYDKKTTFKNVHEQSWQTIPKKHPTQIPCRYGQQCTDKSCGFMHQPVFQNASSVFKPRDLKVDCPIEKEQYKIFSQKKSSVPPCRYGEKCKNTKCVFSHLSPKNDSF